jgi:hypothetical protein
MIDLLEISAQATMLSVAPVNFVYNAEVARRVAMLSELCCRERESCNVFCGRHLKCGLHESSRLLVAKFAD